MMDSKYISTVEEKKIASNLPIKRAKVFLESRAFMRECLSNFLNISPLDIPLKAYPGGVPQVPQNIGKISISHTQNVLVVILHEDKVGIDIENSERKFNYQGLTKKYFQKKERTKNKISIQKKDVLKEWCAIEAAIKWEGGKISKDLKEWEYVSDEKEIYHKNKNLTLTLNQFDYKDWIISIATKGKKYQNDQFIICDGINNIS